MTEPNQPTAPMDASLGLFERVLFLFAQDEKLGLRTEALGPHIGVLRGADPLLRVVVVRYEEGQEAALEERLREIIRRGSALKLELVLVGGEDGAARLLRKVRPFFSTRKTVLCQVRADDSIVGPACGASRLLRHELSDVVLDASSWREFLERALREQEEIKESLQEVRTFARTYEKSRPMITWALAGLCSLTFLVQLAFGLDAPPTLLRMGALSPARVWGSPGLELLQGAGGSEWWRLISCTFLHGGWLHLAFNVYVLVALGSFLERVIGPWRFLLLYTLSGLGGSVASLLFLGDGFSVGASGALWGILGAHAILAFSPRGLLPEAMIAGARKAAMINLGLNLLNSFRPHVDMAAHFGGGLVGAVLLLALLTRGLPRLQDWQEQDAPPDRMPVGLRLSAAALGALFLLGLGLGPLQGRPWELRSAPAYQRVESADLAVVVDVPQILLTPSKAGRAEGGELAMGDVRADPVFIWAKRFPLPLGSPNQKEAEWAALLHTLSQPPKGAKAHGGPREDRSGRTRRVTVRYDYPSGLTETRSFLLGDRALYRLDVLGWSQFDAWQDAPAHIAKSFAIAGDTGPAAAAPPARDGSSAAPVLPTTPDRPAAATPGDAAPASLAEPPSPPSPAASGPPESTPPKG